MDRGKAVGAEVLSTIVGFLCRVPSVRNEEIALFSQRMTFWRGTAHLLFEVLDGPCRRGMSDLYDKIKSNVAFRPKSTLLDGMDGNSNLRAIWK
jgi:hypothetical protein